MRLFPAIDIQGGRCVRLRRGDFADETVFGDDPVIMAEHWVAEGARFLHVVDLDGARTGDPTNLGLVEDIAKAVPVPVQFGGGVRTSDVLERAMIAGIGRLVVGTSALLDQEFLARALEQWGDRLVVAVDAEEGYVKTHGWRERSGMTAPVFAQSLEQLGVTEIIYTDIGRDGMMQGVNLRAIIDLARETSLSIIASGGVTSLDDLRALKRFEAEGVTGVIAGRALYEHRFTVPQALAVLDA
jgi:phosphoribosylformimino-5-aminoimidazole carboxamide ribotide isomerase